MGYQFLDQYSILHLSVGVIAYFWNVPFLLAFIAHAIFEVLENTTAGVAAINKYIIDPGYFSWPGGKHQPDSLINQTGDNVAFAVGWLVAAYLDVVGTREHWYIRKHY